MTDKESTLKEKDLIFESKFFSPFIIVNILAFLLTFGFGLSIILINLFFNINDQKVIMFGNGVLLGSIILFLLLLYRYSKLHPFRIYSTGIEFPPLYKSKSGDFKKYIIFDHVKKIIIKKGSKVLDREIQLEDINKNTYPLPIYHLPEDTTISILRNIFDEDWDSIVEEKD